MVEQKPNQPKSQLEASDPQGYSARGKGFLQRTIGERLSRRIVVPAALMLGGLVGGSAAGCDNESPTTSESSARTSITQPENPTTLGSIPNTNTTGTTLQETTTSNSTSTTEVPTTSTTEVPTTTTTEVLTGLDPEFISKEKTLADVAGEIEIGKPLKEPDKSVPADMQELFQSKNPKNKLLYVGKNGWKSVLTTKPWLFNDSVSDGPVYDFFAGNPEKPWGEYANFATMEFLDVVLIPDSEDFYMRGQNPLTGSEMYIRTSPNNDKTIDYPVVYPFDMAANTQKQQIFGVGNDHSYVTWKKFLKSHKLSDIIQPGDILYIGFAGVGRGDLSDPANIKWEVAVDERDVQYVASILFPIFDETEKYEKIYVGS
ncbi:hypothetical protein KKG52_02615 [Patescibacteria group bacterium]|nr:hypothetical protein [Patescibacteria group bacterium]